MTADGTCARSAGSLAKALGMVSPNLSPFLNQATGVGVGWIPCCGCRALGETRAALPEGELGEGPLPSWHWLHLSHDAGSCRTLFPGCCGASPGCDQRGPFPCCKPSQPQDTQLCPDKGKPWGWGGDTSFFCPHPVLQAFSQLRVFRCQTRVSAGSQMLKKAFQELGGPNRVAPHWPPGAESQRGGGET